MNQYESTKWGVHVKGPNTILAAHSFQEAVEKSQEINAYALSRIPEMKSPFYPLLWATVERWEDLTTSEHNPAETDWSETC